jgi:hypothetical protein
LRVARLGPLRSNGYARIAIAQNERWDCRNCERKCESGKEFAVLQSRCDAAKQLAGWSRSIEFLMEH